jgi:WD40 repeat protein
MRVPKDEIEDLKDSSEFLLIGHSGPVYSVSISVDDKFMISGSFDCTGNNPILINIK